MAKKVKELNLSVTTAGLPQIPANIGNSILTKLTIKTQDGGNLIPVASLSNSIMSVAWYNNDTTINRANFGVVPIAMAYDTVGAQLVVTYPTFVQFDNIGLKVAEDDLFDVALNAGIWAGGAQVILQLEYDEGSLSELERVQELYRV